LENKVFFGESNILVPLLSSQGTINEPQIKRVSALKKKEILKVLTLTIILFSAVWMFNVQASHASKTIVVPQDYATINEAVSQASAGDTVSVQKGIYQENVQINKSISVMGEDAKSTIIIGTGGGNHALAAITVTADYVKVSGFTIESLNYTSSSLYATGINIQGDHCTVTGNIIQNNYLGIFCSIQSYTEITGNTISHNLKDGMRFYGGSLNEISDNNISGNTASGIAIAGYSNTILKNTLENNLRGIGLGSTYSVVAENTIRSNTESGIYLAGSENTISANSISNNKWGIYITPQLAASHANHLYHNNLNNVFNAFDNSSSIVENWDNGYPSGGNYWSDYTSRYPNATETNKSGIGNTPYLIWSDNIDNYPLITPFDITNQADTPLAIPPATASPNSIVASWSFDEVDSNGVTPDTTGQNPAVLGSTNGNKSFNPALVDGEFGKALRFNGEAYVNVRVAPSMETLKDLTIDTWVNVQSFKANVAYNNIIVEVVRTTDATPTRTLGLAINGAEPQNTSSPVIGAFRAYVFTKNEGFNEIATTQPIPLNQWIHVVFTRSLATGMHIYVDGKEQVVNVTAGVANPSGAIMRQNEMYIGHDAICTIDELKISNSVEQSAQPLWMQWWLWTAIIFAGVAGSGLVVYFTKRGKASATKTKRA
jgi:parallel beta-helix repeat protein